MKINLKDPKRFYQQKMFHYYSSLTLAITRIFDKLENKSKILESKIEIIDKYFNYFFIITSFIAYLCFKTFFQTGMGGDDSRLYMYYPSQFLEEAANNKRFAALEDENNQVMYINTLKVLAFLEKNGLNYKDYYFLIFYLSFLFFYLCLKEIQKKLNFEGLFVKYFVFFLAILYPSNPLMVDQVWNNHWNSIFGVCAIPLLFLIFLKIIFKTANFINLIFLNLILTSMSIFFTNVVHLIAMCLPLILSFVIYVFLNKKDILKILVYTLFFLILFITTNILWIHPLLFKYSSNPFQSSGQSANANLYYTLNYYNKEINNFNFVILHGVNKNSYFDLLYYFIFTIFLAFLFFSIIKIIKNLIKGRDKISNLKLLLPFSVSLITAFYLQTIAMTGIGIKLFVTLAEYFYYLNGFRNYINKVPPTYSIFFILFIFVIFYKIYQSSRFLKISLLVSSAMFSLVAFRNLILLEDYKFNMPEGMVRNTSFSSDSMNLFSYIRDHKEIERTVYIPLSTSTWSIFKNENQLFIGNSPIITLSGVNDYNGFWFSEQIDTAFFPFQNSLNQSFGLSKPENFLKHLNFVSADTLILNNTVNIDKVDYPGYTKTGNYENLTYLIRKNLELKYETPNKEFSVYKLPNKIISFKEKIYNIPSQLSNENFYMLDYNKEIFIKNSLENKFINYNLIDFTSFPISKIDNVNKIYDSKQNLVEMNKRDYTVLNDSKDTSIIYFENNKDNIVRFVVDISEGDLSLKLATEDRGSSCALKVFQASYCRILRNFTNVQKVGDSYVYTTDLIYPTNKTFGYLKLKNSKQDLKKMNLRVYTYSNYKSDFENSLYNSEQKQKLISDLFDKNTESYNYQIPENIDIQKIDRDSYRITANYKNTDQPSVLTLNKIYSQMWEIEGKGFETAKHFPSNIIFNGWVIKPNSKNLDIKITFKEPEISSKFKPISDYSTKGSIIIVIIFGIYGTSKILIRKFWR